ncbi:MAG: tRNA epoxyqueuosine(34) reductase QueG [Planctomycetia bacterium]
MGSLAAELRAHALRLGFSRVGIASAGPPPRHDLFRSWLDRGFAGVMESWLRRHEPLRGDPRSLLPGARTVVMLATDYSSPEAAETVGPAPAGRGKMSRYAWGDDYHDLLRARVNALADWLRSRLPGCATRGVVDSAPLAEREFGWLAGLGWFGKNTMLIDPDAGSFFFLTALLTDIEFPIDEPIQVDHCGTCTACLDACPTGALPAPRVLDARKCVSALTIEDHGSIDPELRPSMSDWVFGCDICQDVCPWNRKAPVSAEPVFQPREGHTTLPLADLLDLDDAAFRKRFQGSPLERAKRRGLARSAAIALGNTPDPAAAGALARAVHDPDPVVREAAAWALGRWRNAGGELAEMADAAQRAQADAESHSVVSSTSADGSRPAPSAK